MQWAQKETFGPTCTEPRFQSTTGDKFIVILNKIIECTSFNTYGIFCKIPREQRQYSTTLGDAKEFSKGFLFFFLFFFCLAKQKSQSCTTHVHLVNWKFGVHDG